MQGTEHALIADYLGLVRSIATHIAQTLPRFVELNDLIQSGTLGLIEAARRFDSQQQASFPTYAKHRIRGAILDSLRKEDSLTRDMRTYQKRIQTASRQLEQEHKREATTPEIAAALGLEVKHLGAIQQRLQQAREVYVDQPKEDGMPKADFPDRPEDRPDAIFERRRLQAEVRNALGKLPERQRLVLHLYYSEELTMREIGAIMGVNESRISQIHKRAASSLAVHLDAPAVRYAAA